jgi:hypothetical protein
VRQRSPRTIGFLLAVALTACGDEPVPPVEHARADLAGVDLPALDSAGADLSGAADLAEPPAQQGTPCGAALCADAPDYYCQTDDWGETGTCQTSETPAQGYFGCDGPEDCASGACCLLDHGSVCSAVGFCVADTVIGEFMCHTDRECGPLSRCCRKGSHGPYRTCIDGLSPTDACPAVP